MWRDIPWVGRARYILFFFAIGPCPPPAYFDGRITCILLRQGREPPPCGLGGGWLTERDRALLDGQGRRKHSLSWSTTKAAVTPHASLPHLCAVTLQRLEALHSRNEDCPPLL